MVRLNKTIAIASLATLVTVGLSPSALAFRSSIGAVSGQQKLTKGMGKTEGDLAFSPILLEMAKLIGRTGLPPGFFLQNDGPLPEEPGVDLRTLLLYQAGLIKMPIRLLTGRKSPTTDEPLPQITLQTMPRGGGNELSSGAAAGGNDVPSLASTPLPRDPMAVKVITGQPSVGSPEKVQIAAATASDNARPAPAPLVSLDISKLQADLKVFGEDESAPEVKADVPQLAMAMPRTNVMPFITQNAFRLWTFRSDAASAAAANPDEPVGAEFNGTFVIATTGVIKSITGRQFVLNQGKLLASNKAGDLLFTTPVGTINVMAEATAVIEVEGNFVRVYALETPNNSRVTFKLPKEEVSLAAGEVLLIADHPLTSAEIQAAKLDLKKVQPTVARGTFSVKDFVQRDLIASPQARANDADQYQTLSALKKRVTDQH